MRGIAQLCLAKKRRDMYAKALGTIVEIADIEEKCPVAKAQYHAELGIAQYDCGQDSSDRLRKALSGLRKRGEAHIVKVAALCLGKQVRPKRRIRVKTHIECV